MGSYKEIEGDLFDGIFNEDYDVTVNGLNCFNSQGAGIVIPFKKHFQTDKFPMELSGKGDINKLGQIDCKSFWISRGKAFECVSGHPEIDSHVITICNCYSQYHYGMNHTDGTDKPIDYEALTLCLRKVNHKFKGSRVGLPAIGAGLGGGDLNLIRLIIKKELKDCDATLVLFKK